MEFNLLLQIGDRSLVVQAINLFQNHVQVTHRLCEGKRVTIHHRETHKAPRVVESTLRVLRPVTMWEYEHPFVISHVAHLTILELPLEKQQLDDSRDLIPFFVLVLGLRHLIPPCSGSVLITNLVIYYISIY